MTIIKSHNLDNGHFMMIVVFIDLFILIDWYNTMGWFSLNKKKIS
jgi:hypothetical protein